ncbi:hypothetical protein FQA39_LY04117 [Lamprigera yunnana]|nr:hypothetical protein FQA39_LY04117 [Lamprigera yunnana]
MAPISDQEKRDHHKQQNLWKNNLQARQKVVIELEKTEDDMNNNSESKQDKMKINSLYQKLQRLKIKKPDSTSPKPKVNKLLKARNVDPEVCKTFLFHEVMVREIQSFYRDTRSLKFKQILDSYKPTKNQAQDLVPSWSNTRLKMENLAILISHFDADFEYL